uniref:Uncharacterized protein n=1 Tax=Physcomitrium patens TaxID=3218 RepID=A0A2K1KXN3_PHYPA|nr:hypothetical protein PHYPA_005526 [Physcomitrium patens]
MDYSRFKSISEERAMMREINANSREGDH